MNNQMKLVSVHQYDNRAAHVYKMPDDVYEVQYIIKGAGIVDQVEHDTQDQAIEQVFEWLRGARFN